MEDAHFTETEKSKTSEVKCENDAHCFFRCSRNREPGIRSSWTDCQSGILLGGFEATERECAKKTPRIVEIRWMVSPSGQHPSSHGCVCDPVFGLSGMDRHSPPTLFTGPSPLWFLFVPDNEKKHWKERDFPPWRRLKQLCRRHSTTSSFGSSRDASHSGKKDWTSVLPPMESILKGVKCFLFEMWINLLF